MRVKYVGEIESVQIPSAGVVVSRGEVLETTEEIGASLLLNENFREVKQIKVQDTKPIRNYQTKGSK